VISERDIAGQGRDAQIAAYKTERDGVLHKLSLLRSIDPDTRYVLPATTPYAPQPGLMLGPTAADLVAEAEQQLADIERAIEALEALS
jgi:hypothetical protein